MTKRVLMPEKKDTKRLDKIHPHWELLISMTLSNKVDSCQPRSNPRLFFWNN